MGVGSRSAWPYGVQMIATDNLDLGCTIFEKAATEKAIREIDERLIQQYTNRAKAKGGNQPFLDHSQLHGRFPLHLPDSLKPKPGHLNPAQQRVYEDFARIPRGAAGAHAAVGGGKPVASLEKVRTSNSPPSHPRFPRPAPFCRDPLTPLCSSAASCCCFAGDWM